MFYKYVIGGSILLAYLLLGVGVFVSGYGLLTISTEASLALNGYLKVPDSVIYQNISIGALLFVSGITLSFLSELSAIKLKDIRNNK